MLVPSAVSIVLKLVANLVTSEVPLTVSGDVRSRMIAIFSAAVASCTIGLDTRRVEYEVADLQYRHGCVHGEVVLGHGIAEFGIAVGLHVNQVTDRR